MSRIYYYKLTADTGGAPCVENGLLSLAICKPMIRRTAEEDSLIFGFAAKSLHPDNRLLYVARVSKNLRDGEYYKDARYAHRGDCIYRFKGDCFEWKKRALHHGPKHLEHDLGKPPDYPQANVLLSTDFRYFGKAGSAEYKTKFCLIGQAVEYLGQGHRVQHDHELRKQLLRMKAWVWRTTKKKKFGEPTSKPSRSICYRSKSCGET